MTEVITSAKNPHVLYLQSLLQKKHRDAEGKFLVEGLRFVEEAVQAGALIEEVIITPEMAERSQELLRNLPAKVAVTTVAGQLFKKFTATENPQGLAALVRKKEYAIGELLGFSQPFILVIEQVQDPGNLGTIIRTADAAGCTGIILVKGSVDLYNPKTLRSTMGSVFHLPIVTVGSTGEALEGLREHNITTYAADVSEHARDYLAADFTIPVALLIGNEAKGISDTARQGVDEHIMIKMPGRAESLNVAVAAGIMLFEAARQRQDCRAQNDL